jgi:hypothetical protein
MSKFEEFKKDKIKSVVKSAKKKDMAENMDMFVYRNIKEISMGIVELINNTLYHGFDTLKVRLQAKCKIHDTSCFFKNKVDKKRIFV